MSSGFVSEADIAERRKVREELWKAQKGENDPEEEPVEEKVDFRNLYDRLQEQKDKKQEDWDEAHKLKNMVRGLEDDEVDFLEFVDTTKIREVQRIKNEEAKALIEYRKKVADFQKQGVPAVAKVETSEAKRASLPSKKISHMSLLAGTIKRKCSDSDDSKSISNDCEAKVSTGEAQHDSMKKRKTEKEFLPVIAVLPGLGVYTDSSDSSDSEGDGEGGDGSLHPRDLTGRIIKLQEKHC